MGRAAGEVKVDGCMEGAGSEIWKEVLGVEVSAGFCGGTTLARLGSGAQSGATTSAARLAAEPLRDIPDKKTSPYLSVEPL